MSMCQYNNLLYFIEKQATSAQSPDNEIIASNKKFPGLQLVGKGEATFSDLNFYKIVKIKRKVNENVMIRILQFFIPTKNLIKMFKAPTLPPKKSPAITRHLICHLKGMKIKTLMFWEMQVNQNVKLFLKNLFSTINILNSFYVSVGL